ncbi:MAG: two pore domain potassium channel family protein [Actinobacteria bacterium]|nr:two pore domain potassium channel family protein [Actinomycetota bacterium]
MTRLERWERRSEWPLAALAVVFLIAYATPILDTHLSPGARTVCHWTDYAVWIVFAVDYLTRLYLTERRWAYWVRHLHDLAMIALPVLRPLRLLRLLMLLRLLNRRAAASLHGRVAVYVGGSAIILIGCASLAVLDAERGHHGANITTFGDALWWSVTTVTTVGYGDRYPVTTEGRFVAVGLMLGGVALIGVVTATVASWLVDRVRAVTEDEQAATRADIERLTAEIEGLKELLTQQHEGGANRTTPR